jgi:hypothetical protein
MCKRQARQHTSRLFFAENTRGYTLAIHRTGRMVIEATSGGSCLEMLRACDDNETIEIIAHHRDREIGRGTYRKHGPPGSIPTVETLSASGTLVGFIESALARREEVRQQQLQTERAARLTPIACSCEHLVGYDVRDQCFARSDGRVLRTCPLCKEPLDLERIESERRRRITSLQQELQRQQTALSQLQRIPRKKGEG